MNGDPFGSELGETWRRVLAFAQHKTRVSIPAVVKAYRPEACEVDVVPCVAEVMPTADGVERFDAPVVPSVPVAWPRAGGYFVRMPIAVGDTVLLLVADRALDEWRERGGENVATQHERTHHIADAVALPMGIAPDNALPPNPAPSGLTLGAEDGSVRIVIQDGRVEITADGATPQAVALAPPLEELWERMRVLVNAAFAAHTHPVAPIGGTLVASAVPGASLGVPAFDPAIHTTKVNLA